MNHYGFGRITAEGEIDIPVSLLRPLSITNKVMAWGMLYPADTSGNKKSWVKYDIVLSPIPFKLWPKTARLVVRTPHQSGVFKQLSSFLKDQKASILISEASRSAYGHDTWSLIINFDDLDGKKLGKYNRNSKLYDGIEPRIKLMNAGLESLRKKDFFYTESGDSKLEQGFNLYPHHANSYFYWCHQESQDDRTFRGGVEKSSYKTFQFKCNTLNRLLPVDGGNSSSFRSIVDDINAQDNYHFPCCAFAELDTADRNLRIAVISQEVSQSCFGLNVPFIRHTNDPNTSRGFTDAILQSLPDNINVLAMTSKTDLFVKDREEGRLELMLFDERGNTKIEQHENTGLSIIAAAELKIPKNLRIATREKYTKTLEALCSQGLTSINPSQPRHVFLSYSSANSKQADIIVEKLKCQGIACYMAGKNLNGGDRAEDKIRDDILLSYEVIILCSPQSLESDWVRKELGAAWVLKKRIVPITYQCDISSLPLDLKSYQAYDFSEILITDPKFGEWKYPQELALRIAEDYS